jgi:nucleoside-diphosphate-sugar epimerase
LIIRAGDFFGPLAGNNWFSEALVKPGQAATVITYPGRSGVGHQWAYVPDLAETVVRLLETSKTLDHFAVFQLKSHWDDCTQMIEAICKAAGNPNIKFASCWGIDADAGALRRCFGRTWKCDLSGTCRSGPTTNASRRYSVQSRTHPGCRLDRPRLPPG